jgi:hypothetical protein
MSTRNTENTTSLYWFGPPESNTLRPVVGVDCLRIELIVQWVASSALYWPTDEVGSQTPSRFPDYWSVTTTRSKSMLHILPYPIDLLWS